MERKAWTNECGQLLEAEAGEEPDSALEPGEEMLPCCYWAGQYLQMLAQGDPVQTLLPRAVN